MNKQDIAWILVRCAGLWMLVQALMILPTFLGALPVICEVIISWDMISDTSWTVLLGRGTVSNTVRIVCETGFLFISASWLLVRGDCLIQLIARCRN
ncbi:hypothetical protein M3P05_04200 [Sansalvadorimonas sp. 2012CJ34-2]|uniref:Uncharacterized protein n=1 Tax=Parendozoicomonas callyspongiae TaxID=2942213 RepID=A0ABT0PCR3_9GAMM|nr:hypothetical protein [Sansalvadorimonas sp. 2012CJ34-2]MCL6269144.1 hypothetical protein [Sansalvadorimonas sp. 2012CJ34-2]